MSVNLDKIAQIFEQEIVPIWSRPFSQILLRYIPKDIEGEVLELGSGTGYLALKLVNRLKNNSRITALEPSAELLEIAFRRTENAVRQKKLFFLHKNLEKIPFDREVFDLVYSNLGIFYSKDSGKFLKGIFKILKPGKWAYLTLPIAGSFEDFFQISRDYLLHSQRQIAIDRLKALKSRFYSPQPIQTLSREIGFENISLHPASFSIDFPDNLQLLRSSFVRFHFIDLWLPKLDKKSREQITLEMSVYFDQHQPQINGSLQVKALCVALQKPE